MTTGDIRALSAYLRRWDARRRRGELLAWLPRGLLLGLLIGLAAAVLSRAQPLLSSAELVRFAGILALAATALVIVIVLLRRRSLAEQARFADRQFRLRERMIAAVEIQSGLLAADERMAAGQLNDALAAAAFVDPVREMPLAVSPSRWLPAAAALVALAALLWLPNPQEAVLLERREVAAVAAEQAGLLEELSGQIAGDESLTAGQREALLKPLDAALAGLAQPNLNREELMATLSQAETEMRSLAADFDTTSVAEALAGAAGSLGENPAASDLAEALQAGQLREAAAAAGTMADSLDGLAPGELADLSGRLAEAAEGLEAADPELAGALDRAAAALAESDIAAAEQALNEVEAALGERAQSQAAAGQAALAADQLDQARGEVAQGGTQADSGGESSAGTGQDSGEQSGSAPGAGSSGQQGGVGGPSQGGGHVENVFVPAPANLEGEGQGLELDVQCLNDPESCGPVGSLPSTSPGQESGGSLVPYDQVFGQYRDAAFEALSGGDIPLRLQDLVRDYFTALEP